MQVTTSAEGWTAARPRTLVDHVIDQILSAAARGLILPGDRLVEKDLSASLNMSRVPIREALRVLESQGVVTSEPYKGIRLMEITQDRLSQILDVRTTLETLAATRAIEAGRNAGEALAPLRRSLQELRLMGERGEVFSFASADTAFHMQLVCLGGNQPLVTLWQSLARQLTVIIGLAVNSKDMKTIVSEHERLLDTIASGDLAAVRKELTEHIITEGMKVDFDLLHARRMAAQITAA
ncbi:GntR family transcriptional regulator [Falsirhodobacter halotolerans]|uniref:GntR family transcriptional regulator n=1 Tax=Falsirhodobacter halotolerans TaxID=1146892 RepID=UPI001FCF9F24|nr:GntR family transcriptional regulator [Falsirhodobacter halotolerans]MCJ8139099.1 GntR family transcriptional regulator [Falsirhodobacter halotolerans]